MPASAASQDSATTPASAAPGHHRDERQNDKHHEDHEIDHEHRHDPALECAGEYSFRRALEPLDRGDPIPPDQLAIEEVDQLSRLGHLEVPLVRLQEAVEGGLDLIAW